MPQNTWLEIKNHCLSTGTLYEDAEFPAKDTSAFVTMKPAVPFEWKRPGELVSEPCLFVGGASRDDISQGSLGNCWFLAALAGLTQEPQLLNRVIPDLGQSFGDGYFGAFRFNFWQEGDWVEVIIDDHLPTHRSKLVFTHSVDRNEFWVALLEKAYAKLHGSYEALTGGHAIEAMEDFTGGIGENFHLKKPPEDLFGIMQTSFNHGSLMSCSIDAEPDEMENISVFDLVKGHAYTVTGLQKVSVELAAKTQQVKLVRLKNPWSSEYMWLGAWAEKSREWRLVSDSEKRRIGLRICDDGEFWMSFEDFIKHFDRLEVCLLGPESGGNPGTTWEVHLERGEWRRDVTAGGCRKYLTTFATNPQFRFDVKEPGTVEDTGSLSFVVVALMQTGRRKSSRKDEQQMLGIGFAIYKAQKSDLKNGKLDKDFFAKHRTTARSKVFSNQREVTGRFHLPAGTYYVIPSTFHPGDEGSFILRIFVEKGEDESQPPVIASEIKMKESRCMDVNQVQQVLSTALSKDLRDELLPLEVCRSIVGQQDKDKTGRLSREELNTVMLRTNRWKDLFSKFANSNGTLNVDRLESVLVSTDIDAEKMSDRTMSAITAYFSKEEVLTFSSFLLVMARLSTLQNVFYDRSNSSYSLDEFLCQTIVL